MALLFRLKTKFNYPMDGTFRRREEVYSLVIYRSTSL
jgi:hypothetical protein